MARNKWIILCLFLFPFINTIGVEKVEINGIYYLLKDDGSAEVTFKGEGNDGWMYFEAKDLYVGDIAIPNAVQYNDVSYQVTALGNDAFAGCKAMRSLSLPATIASIGNGLFSLCNSLSSIQVKEDNPIFSSQNGILYEKKPYSICYVPKAIQGDIELPSGLTEIPSSAFQNCTKITTITLSVDIITIGDGAFSGCSSLQEIFMGNKITDIGVQAFSKCPNLTIISIPSSVKRIQKSAFADCTNLIYVLLNNGLQEIEEMAFYNCGEIIGIELPKSLTTIGSQAFKECTKLSTIKNNSNLELVLGSTNHGYVAKYATEIISAQPTATNKQTFTYTPSYYKWKDKLIVRHATGHIVLVYSVSGQLLYKQQCISDMETFDIGHQHVIVLFKRDE